MGTVRLLAALLSLSVALLAGTTAHADWRLYGGFELGYSIEKIRVEIERLIQRRSGRARLIV